MSYVRKQQSAEQRRVYDRRYCATARGRDVRRKMAAARRRRLGRAPRNVTEKTIRVQAKRLKHSVSLTVDQFVAMDEAQDFCCAICGGEMLPPHIDHCHNSRRVRGLLCRNCNSGIGLLGDDPQRLTAAANYVTADMR